MRRLGIALVLDWEHVVDIACDADTVVNGSYITVAVERCEE